LSVLGVCVAVLGFGIRDALPLGSTAFIRDIPGDTAGDAAAEYSPVPFDIQIDLGKEPAIEVTALVLAPSAARRIAEEGASDAEDLLTGACFVTDGELDNEYDKVLAEAEEGDCAFAPRPQLAHWHTAYNRRFSIRCDLAAVLNDFETRLDQIAEQELGTTVTRIDQVGGYTCRNTYGSPEGRPSEHARANAIDISGFKLADGRMVTLSNDWRKDTPEGRFLMRVRDEACGLFRAVLSPDYNAAHADHFHLDLGRFDMCT
jgi:hypothetical protein